MMNTPQIECKNENRVADRVTTEVNSVEKIDNRLIYKRYLNRFELGYTPLLLLRVERTIGSFHPHKKRFELDYTPPLLPKVEKTIFRNL